ncbi:MAG TPA: GAF domain-containing protein [Thermoanaerobaculia bacterium]|nr:GAF domain-containing protein [Thermoanaerobaculia bacterium]
MSDASEDRARLEANAEASALAELALCENLSQISGWAARWSAELARADSALLWAPDTVHPLFLCIGAYGADAERFLRRSVPRGEGFVGRLTAEHKPVLLQREDFASSQDPWLKNLPGGMESCLALPLEAESTTVGVLALAFHRKPDAMEPLSQLQGFVQHAAPALARALRAERKTVGMLHAIERLTNLYDLSKSFGSTIDEEELTELIARKAVDMGVAEVCSIWEFEPREADVALAATAINENYDVENAPDAVGASIVGDVLADQKIVRRNRLPEIDSLSLENPTYPVRSVLAMPLIEGPAAVGALILTNKRGRLPEFTPEDEELLQDLARQAVRALRNARQHEAEKKVEELDALLTVSREITATLDLDKVMTTIVNATAPLIAYDRCAIAIMQRGKVRVGAVSGKAKPDRKDPKIRRLEELLQWVYFSGTPVAVTQEEDGRIVTERPEDEEKFRAYFRESGFRSFYAVLLKDEEGKLGVLSFERKTPLVLDVGKRDLLDILVNQATVAVRNAQLYQQVPLAGFWKPVLEKRQKLFEIPKRRRIAWGIGALAVLLFLIVVPWKIRLAGPARVLPGRRAAATAGVDGVVSSVLRREGDAVRAGDVIATLGDEQYVAGLEEARTSLAIAESEVARYREAGDAGAMFAARSKRDELAAKIAFASDQFARTRIRAPVEGVIVTPRIEERVGQFFPKGTELCVVANIRSVTAEVAIDEPDAALLRTGENVALKLNPYPTRTFRGTVSRVSSFVREEGTERFVIAEVGIANPDASLKTGMLGKAKISTVRRPILFALVRKPLRWAWNKVWPILP